jgi:hypothetical protein
MDALKKLLCSVKDVLIKPKKHLKGSSSEFTRASCGTSFRHAVSLDEMKHEVERSTQIKTVWSQYDIMWQT